MMLRTSMVLCLVLALVALVEVEAASAEPGHAGYKMRVVYEDSDRDGIPDYLDVCPGSANIGRDDTDGDRLIDACDLDPFSSGRVQPVSGRFTTVSDVR